MTPVATPRACRVLGFFLILTVAIAARGQVKDPGHPNLIINRQQLATIRQKIAREPYKALWKRILNDADQVGQRSPVKMLRDSRVWERALVWAVTGQNDVSDLRQGLLYRATQPVAPVTSYEWSQGSEAVIYDLLGESFSPAENQKIREYFSAKAAAAIAFATSYHGTLNMMSNLRWNIALLGYAARDQKVTDWAIDDVQGLKQGLEKNTADNIWGEADGYAIFYVLPGWIAVAEAANNYDGTDLWNYTSPNGNSLKGILDRYIDLAYPIEQTGIGAGTIRIASYGDGSTQFSTAYEPDDIYLVNTPYLFPRDDRRSIAACMEIAYARFKDPKYAYFLSLDPHRNASHDHGNLNYTALTHGIDLPANPPPPPAPSGVWKNADKAMLRADESPNYWTSGSPAAFLVMNKWYSHDHRDKLGLMFHANGRLLYPDMNVTQYEADAIGWTRHGIAHNLVLVDGQGPWGGNSDVREDRSDDVKFLAVTADPSEAINKSMNPLGVWETRALALTREYMLDTFWVSSKNEKPHEYTWVLHGLGRLRTDDAARFLRPDVPKLKPFRWIRDERSWATDSDWSVEWVQQSGGVMPNTSRRTQAWFNGKPVGVRMTMLGVPGTQAFIGQGPLQLDAQYGIDADDAEGSIPVSLAQRTARSTIFTALHEPFIDRPHKLKLRRIAETENVVAVEVGGTDFTDVIVVDLDRQTPRKERAVQDTADPQQTIRFDGGFAYVRLQGDQLRARGGIKSFRIHASGVKHAQLNGKPIDVAIDRFGYVRFNDSPASSAPRKQPAEPKIQPGAAAILAPMGPVLEPVRINPGKPATLRLRLENLLSKDAPCRAIVESDDGLSVSPKLLDAGVLKSNEDKEIQFNITSTKAAAGKLHSIKITPQAGSQPGQTLSVPVAVGVCLIKDFGRGGQFDQYRALAPNYVAAMSSRFGVIESLLDRQGRRRSSFNSTGLNHWGFPSVGNAWSKEDRVFGINGVTVASGREVQLAGMTEDTITYKSTHGGELLKYHFFQDHIDMSVETKPGENVEMCIGEFDRLVMPKTTVRWSDGSVDRFGVSRNELGTTYHSIKKKCNWVAFDQSEPFDKTDILLKFPREMEVTAGTRAQLYFDAEVKSGEVVQMYFLPADQLHTVTGTRR